MHVLFILWLVMGLLVMSVCGSNYCDCPCLNETNTCAGLHLTCANEGYLEANENRALCNDQEVECPVDKLEELWVAEEVQCICPPGYRGVDCRIETEEKCGETFDDTFRPSNDEDPDKIIFCQVGYVSPDNDVVNELIYLIGHRVELTIFNTTHIGLDMFSRVVRRDDITCGQAERIFSCTVGGCLYGSDGDLTSYMGCDQDIRCELCTGQGCGRYEVLADVDSLSVEFDSKNTGNVEIGLTTWAVGIHLPINCEAGMCQTISEAVAFQDDSKTLQSVEAVAVTSTTLALTLLVCVAGVCLCRGTQLTLCGNNKLQDSSHSEKEEEDIDAIVLKPLDPSPEQPEVCLPIIPATEQSEGVGLTVHPDPSAAANTTAQEHVVGDNEEGVAVSASSVSALDAKQSEERAPLSDKACTFVNIAATAEDNTVIIHDVNGYIDAGQTLAIVGASGAGKTTLLNVLAKRRKLSSGVMTNASSFGYVTQHDYLLDTQTVREALWFSARLRSPYHATNDELSSKIERVCRQLAIHNLLDKLIGNPTSGGLSGGERRRVSIGLELVCDPQALLLDEPTSGLDSFNALRIVQLLRSLSSRRNIPLVLTIHQIPSHFLTMFDLLLVMAKDEHSQGGVPVYFGSTNALPTHLALNCKQPVPQFHNPAEHVLMLTMTMKTQTLLDAYIGSSEHTATHELLESVTKTTQSLEGKSGHASVVVLNVCQRLHGWFRALGLLMRRDIVTTTRSPLNLFTHNIAFGVFGLLFAAVAADMPLNIEGMQGRLGTLFWFCIFFAFTSISSAGLFVLDRPRFLMELSKQYYTSGPYTFAKILADMMTLRIVPPIVFSVVSYFLIGFQDSNDKFLIFVSILVLVNIAAAALTLLVSALAPSVSQANFYTIVCLIYCMIFSGLFLNLTSNPTVTFLSSLSFLRYGYEVLIVNEFDGLTINFAPEGAPNINVAGEVVIAEVGMDPDALERDIWLLSMFTCLYLLLTFVTIKVRCWKLEM